MKRVPEWLFLAALCLSASSLALADHGPGTTGGSARTPTGDTMPRGAFAVSLVSEWTDYDDLSPSEMLAAYNRIDGEVFHFDTLNTSLLTSLDVEYGIVDGVSLGVSIGLYRGDDLAGIEGGEFGPEYLAHGDVGGLTDPWIRVKGRVLRSPYGNLALQGGVKLPLGRSDVISVAERTRLEPAVQPGTGAIDFMVGAGYSVWLSRRVTVDAGVTHTFRGENDFYRLGDRTDYGLALAYRWFGSMSPHPRVTMFAEISGRTLQRIDEFGQLATNTGGTALFGAVGLRAMLTEQFSLTVAPQIPVVQSLNSEQQETAWKLLVALTISGGETRDPGETP